MQMYLFYILKNRSPIYLKLLYLKKTININMRFESFEIGDVCFSKKIKIFI